MTTLIVQDVLRPPSGLKKGRGVPARRRPLARSLARSLVRSLVCGGVTGAVLAVLLQVFSIVLGANFHAVVAGHCYRSAQVSAAALERLIHDYDIHTVVNLRGDNVGVDWYEDEKTTTQRLGVDMVDVGLWAYHPPLVEELQRLVDTLATAQEPVLVHCYNGGDRAGLASACYLLLRTAAPLDEAKRELTLRYGHNPYGQARCHDRLLEKYGRWLRGLGATHTPALFRQWVHEKYDRNVEG